MISRRELLRLLGLGIGVLSIPVTGASSQSSGSYLLVGGPLGGEYLKWNGNISLRARELRTMDPYSNTELIYRFDHQRGLLIYENVTQVFI